MPPDWQLRGALTTAILDRRDEALRPLSPLDPDRTPSNADAAAWGVFSLHFLSLMVKRAVEPPQRYFLQRAEVAAYSQIRKTFEGAGISAHFAALQNRLLASLKDIDARVAAGSLPTSLGHLLVGDPARSLSSFSWNANIDIAATRLTTLLSLLAVLYDMSDEPLTAAIGLLRKEVSVVQRHFFANLDLLSKERLHVGLSLLFWGRIALLERQGNDGRVDFREWWPLLEALRTLQLPDDPSDVAPLEHEPEILINLMHLRGEVATARGGLGARAEGAADDLKRGAQLAELNELHEYAEHILRERMEALCAQLSSTEISKLPLTTLYACLRSLLDYHGRVLGPAVFRLTKVEQELKRRAAIRLNPDGSLFPQRSPAWRHFREQCDNIAERISQYATACARSTERGAVRPFLFLVVGQPGTGKSQFAGSVRRALQNQLNVEKGRMVVFEKNLSQGMSTADELGRVWVEVASTESNAQRCDVHFVVLDEFDSLIEERPTQYRQVLAPFWDAKTQDPGTGHTTPLGPFVAVCIMSKCDRLASAKRMLYGIEKGRDFLSRVDEVVEVPAFDSVGTQQELILANLWRTYAKHRKPPHIDVSEAAVWLLSWLRTSDNFRTISKTLKTVPPDVDFVEYRALNLSADLRREFEAVVMDMAGVTAVQLQAVLSDERRFGISLIPDTTPDGIRLSRKSTNLLASLRAALGPKARRRSGKPRHPAARKSRTSP